MRRMTSFGTTFVDVDGRDIWLDILYTASMLSSKSEFSYVVSRCSGSFASRCSSERALARSGWAVRPVLLSANMLFLVSFGFNRHACDMGGRP